MPKLLVLGALAVVALVLTGGARAADTLLTKPSDESASNNTAQADDDLTFAATSGAAYDFELSLVYASPAGVGTPDLKVGFGEDGTVRGHVFCQGVNIADTIAVSFGATNQSTTDIRGGTAAGKRQLRCTGNYLGGGGTFQILWAQNTLNANPVTVYAGSSLRYRLVGDAIGGGGGGGSTAWGDITDKPTFNLSWLDDADTTGAIDGAVLKYDEASSEWQVATDDAGGSGSSGPVTLSAGDRERLDLNWWGVWAIVGLLLVLMIAPQLMSVMRVTRGMADGRG